MIKIFTGITFSKDLGFYYKWNSSYIHLKIPESVNRVIIQNSSDLLLLKYSRQKHVQRRQQRNVIWLSL